MSATQKLIHELKALGLVTLYFGTWLVMLVVIKKLILAEYQIAFTDMSKAVISMLILAKVVIVLEHVSLGAWVRAQPAWIDVLLRTILYSLGVLLVVLLERGLEARHEYGGFGPSLRALFEQSNIYHVWTSVIVISAALLVYNMLAVVRRHLGKGGLLRVFTTPMPEELVQ